jgi:hypothetical protein
MRVFPDLWGVKKVNRAVYTGFGRAVTSTRGPLGEEDLVYLDSTGFDCCFLLAEQTTTNEL